MTLFGVALKGSMAIMGGIQAHSLNPLRNWEQINCSV